MVIANDLSWGEYLLPFFTYHADSPTLAGGLGIYVEQCWFCTRCKPIAFII